MRGSALSLLLLLSPTLLAGQSPSGSRLIWGNVEMVVYPDTIADVGITAGTTEEFDAARFRGFGASFDPAQVPAWADGALGLVNARDLPPNGPPLRAAPALSNAGGDSLLLFRRRIGTRWESEVVIQMVSGRGGPRLDADQPLGARIGRWCARPRAGAHDLPL